MKNQALFSSKDKRKKLKCRMLQFLFDALRVNILTETTVSFGKIAINLDKHACSNKHPLPLLQNNVTLTCKSLFYKRKTT